MTEEFIIEAADNGMTVKAEEYFEVFENTHMDKVNPKTMFVSSSASYSTPQ